MKRFLGKAVVFACMFFCLGQMPDEALQAAGRKDGKAVEEVEQDENRYLTEILKKLDFSEVDQALKNELPDRYRFSDLVKSLSQDYKQASDQKNGEDGRKWLSDIGRYVLDLFFYELSQGKPMFLQMLLLAVLFAVMNRICITKSRYVANMSFLTVYGAMMVLLMQSFLLIHEVVKEGIVHVIGFLKGLVPAYAAVLVFLGNHASAGMFYELTFGMVLLVELAMKYLLVPAVQVFVLLEFIDHLFEKERLSKFAELIESGIGLFIRLSFAGVIGIGTVQSLLTTAKDRISGSTFLKSVSMLPGIGNTIGSAGEILLGCGILVKNSAGAAAVILLFLICLLPLMKIFCFTFLYRLIGALLQPVADERIVECIQGVARAGSLYLRIMGTTMLLFMIVISMVTAATNVSY